MNAHLGLIVLVDGAVWAGWSAVVGYTASRVPASRVDHDGWVTRPRQWEREGRSYERLGIRRWKDHLPEGGAVFRRGVSKRALVGRAEEDLDQFRSETRRAELVHWAILAAFPVFALWNPALLFAAMATYAVIANLPCIAIQRYNRARITRVLRRRPEGG